MSQNGGDREVVADGAGDRVAEGGLRARKRTETRRRIAESAVRLVSEHGITATTVEEIAGDADVSRATFFRYFESKELAIATGLSDVAVYVLTATIRELPPELGPLDAVRGAHDALSVGFDSYRAMYLDQALLSRSSPAMMAWTLHFYVDWEIAIAEAVAPRFDDLAESDPRPRMVGALSMAAARLACDEWVADDGRGDLPALMQKYLSTLDLPVPATAPT